MADGENVDTFSPVFVRTVATGVACEAPVVTPSPFGGDRRAARHRLERLDYLGRCALARLGMRHRAAVAERRLRSRRAPTPRTPPRVRDLLLSYLRP